MFRLAIIFFLISNVLPVSASNAKFDHIDLSDEFVHCYDFGCKSVESLSFSPQQWRKIEAVFDKPALSAWLEKQQIRQAIALMEQYSGQITGTSKDKKGNFSELEEAYQQDCIDESTNTMQYLNALNQRQLLRWHKADGKQRRIAWLWTHWTAVIQELVTGERYAVDSWYRDNGEPPFIQRLSQWERKADFPAELNP